MDGHEILKVARAEARRCCGLSDADRDDAEGAAALKLVEWQARIDPTRPAHERAHYAGKVGRSAVMSYLRWRSSGGRAVAYDEVDVPDPKRWASPEERAAVAELIAAADRLIDDAAAQLPEAQARALRRRTSLSGDACRVALRRAAPVVWRLAMEMSVHLDVDALLRGEA